MSKRQMIQGLLAAYTCTLESGPPDECARQFQIWQHHVAAALAAAGMVEEHNAWVNAVSRTTFYDDDATFPANAEAMNAILLGILDNVERAEPSTELFSSDIVEGTRNYVKKLATQANGCYQNGWYDACAVMVRRLVEVLIIDCFARNGIESKISADGAYYGLDRLITSFFAENSWPVPKSVKKHLPRLQQLKELGDSSAHGKFITSKKQIDDLSTVISNTLQLLIDIAYPA